MSDRKGAFWELFFASQCREKSLGLLVDSVDYSIDNAEEKIESWKYLQANFYNLNQIIFLNQMSNWPCIGHSIRNMLFNHIAIAYDIVTTFITGSEKALIEFSSVFILLTLVERYKRDHMIKYS